MNLPITVWRFEDAPPEYQEMSTNGGDEDWVVLVPPHIKDEYISWMNSSSFDDHPQVFDLPNGYKLYIASHA